MPETKIGDGLSTLEWVKLFGQEIRVRIALDNHTPPRAATALTGWIHQRADEGIGIVLIVGHELVDATRAIYLVDTGSNVTPYYPSFWAPTPGPVPNARRENEPFWIGLHQFPSDAENPTRFATWLTGPRRAYHCKVVL